MDLDVLDGSQFGSWISANVSQTMIETMTVFFRKED